MDSALVLAGSGHGSIDEMQALVDTRSVMWALCRIEVGKGSFRRHKLLCLHLNGQDCPAVTRGRANAHTVDVLQFFCAHGESCHATLELHTKADVTADAILQRVCHIFVTDDLGEYSIESLLADYRTQIQSTPAEDLGHAIADIDQSEDLACTPSSFASCELEHFATGREALTRIGDHQGPCAWVLIGPDPVNLPLVASGYGMDALRDVLSSHNQSVLYGIIRLPVGFGSLRRTRHVFIHAIGEKTSAFRRGRDGFVQPKMRHALGKFADMPIAVEITRTIELSCEMIIEKIRRASVVDDFFLCDQGDSKSSRWVEVLRAPIEQQRYPLPIVAPPSAPQPAEATGAAKSLSPQEAVGLVCRPGSHLNWALFGVDVDLLGACRMHTARARMKPHSITRHGTRGGA